YLDHVTTWVRSGIHLIKQGRFIGDRCERFQNGRKSPQSARQGPGVARTEEPLRRTARQPLQVPEALERQPHLTAQERRPDELVYRVEPPSNRLQIAQRLPDPAGQLSGAHWRDGPVQDT